MPGTTNRGIPDCIPLMQVLKASPLPCINGTLDEEDSPPEIDEGGAICSECLARTKMARACSGCWQAYYCSRAHQMKAWPKHQRECRPWKMVNSLQLGRFMVATRDIMPGELLLDDRPVMIGPKQITEPVCLACYRPVDGSYKCGKCGFPMCGEDCDDAESHQPECKAVQQSGQQVRVSLFGETNSMYECITPVRLLDLRDSNTAVWDTLMQLESHLDKRDSTETAYITQRTVVDIIHDRLRLTQYDSELVHKILGIIDINAFEIRLPDSSIQGVFCEGAMLEHSCIPNTHRTFDADLHLIVRAAVPIKRSEHLTSCYTDSLSTTASRQEHLLTSKFFSCECQRCLDPTELGTFISAMFCPTCTEDGIDFKIPDKDKSEDPTKNFLKGTVTQSDPQSPSSLWTCMTCSSPLDGDYVTRITAVAEEEADEVENSSTVSSCESFLEKWATTFHPNHAYFLNVKYALLHLYGSEEGYEMEDLPPIHLLRKEALCRQLMKVADVVVPGISRLRGSVLYELYQCLFYKAKSMFQTEVISSDAAKKMSQEAYDVLLECARVLSYEPPVQPEGQLGLEAKDELRKMQKWIKNEGWKR